MRYCDICESEIPHGQKFRSVNCKPEAMLIFQATEDPELKPTWSENADGTIMVEICLDCVMGMGTILPGSEVH